MMEFCYTVSGKRQCGLRSDQKGDEMKRKIVWLLMIALISIMMAMIACTGAETTNSSSTAAPGASPLATTPTQASNTTTTTSVANTTTSGDSLANILGLAQKIPTMKYDTVMTTPGLSPITTTTWVKNTKMKMETTTEGMISVVFIDQEAKTAVTYMPAQNIAMQMNFDQAQQSAGQDSSSIEQYNPKNLGIEIVDGKTCVVLEYTLEQATTKTWIWKDRGLPVKAEVTTATGKTVIEYKNYDFSDIPDSVFTLPSGVQIIQTGS